MWSSVASKWVRSSSFPRSTWRHSTRTAIPPASCSRRRRATIAARLQRVLAGLHRDLAARNDIDQGVDRGDDIDLGLSACLFLSLGGPPPLATATAPPVPQPLTATAFGMSLHAATAVDGHDRARLEHLCRRSATRWDPASPTSRSRRGFGDPDESLVRPSRSAGQYQYG
jgi:hypothetical protein